MRILVAGGGTGGHVVPALAVSEELKRRGAEVLFVGSRRADDRVLVKAAGLRFRAISAGRLHRYLTPRLLIEPFQALAGYWQAARLIRQFRPDVVFAKGGYVALPVMRAARRRKIPIVIHESDARPGLSNRIGARWAAAIAVSWPTEVMQWEAPRPLIYTGNPIRPEITRGKAERARKRFNLKPNLPMLLVVGGSQGSRAINRVVGRSLPKLLDELQVVHGVGDRLASEVAEATKGLPRDLVVRYHTRGYFGEAVADLYAAADLVVSRAGAGGLTEIAANGKPAIIIPLPSAASGHQEANAAVFEKAKAAVVLDQDRLTVAEFVRTVKRLIHDPTKRSRMGRQAKQMVQVDAAKRVADLVWQAGKETGGRRD
jgi:UDP-N-acetylglucosamine--N-acetylmuramyl-(pentapeptide) pyrophosphoryl-undecaprenol N-acetylglucosamine transferase